MLRQLNGVADPEVVVPECDCLHTYRATDWPWSIHRPGCPRLEAIKQKYGVAPPAARGSD